MYRTISQTGLKTALGFLQSSDFTIIAKILSAFIVLFQYVL